MSGATPRKRQSSETNVSENVKNIKMECTVKENIPPNFSGLINSYDNNVHLQDILMKITTPKKSRENLKDQPVTPSTNVKLLASVAADCEYVECSSANPSKNDETLDLSCDSDSIDMSQSKVNRKEKSLAVICTRFLAMYPEYPSSDKRIIVSLDEVCIKLGVERRRLYDIVNIFESIDIVTKNAKNQYLWFGKNYLLQALQRLKAAAIKENILEKLQYVLKTDAGGCRQSCILNEVAKFNKLFETPDLTIVSTSPLQEMRREKSLGIMSQKFLMLFLVSPDRIISLGVAAKVLNGFLPRNERAAQIKTQIRRLYDVANVLSSIGLIQKENAFSPCGRKPTFKYIGPDLNNIKDYDRKCTVPRFQHIIEAAEIEHQKLCNEVSKDLIPKSESLLISEKEKAKANIESLQDKASTTKVKNVCNENKLKAKAPVLIQPNLKLFNLKKPAANPLPCYILSNLSMEKPDAKHANPYGTQTFLLINTIAPVKEIKMEPSESQPVNKIPNQQTVTLPLSSEQRDSILRCLNISLSSQQIASIHLDGASQSNNLDTPSNVVKIINKNNIPEVLDSKNSVKGLSQRDVETNSNGFTRVNSTRSNTPSSMQTLDSPLSIPSGYATPIPNVSSDISFMSNSEVHDVLKNIENQANNDVLNNKIGVSNQENTTVCGVTHINSASKTIECVTEPYTTEEKQVPNINVSNNLKNQIKCSLNQVSQLVSNDSCSNDSINLEVSNILKGKNLGDTQMKSKAFLIDEKTVLSPIKSAVTPAQILVPSSLLSPPHIVPETLFVFTTPSSNLQTTKINNTNILENASNSLTGISKNNLY